jgi:hypothetical protein
MSAEKIECAEKWTVLKIAAYAAAYVTSFVASVFGGALATGLTYELTYYRTLSDDISFYVFLTIVPLSFILLAWLAVPRLVRLLFRISSLR